MLGQVQFWVIAILRTLFGVSPGTLLVGGPASATDNAIARFDGTGGATLQNSGATVDDSGNVAGNSFVQGYTTTATAASTTVLTVASTRLQFFTGTTTQTCTLPVASTLTLGHAFEIFNNSTGVVTVQSSGANSVVAMSASSMARLTCILASGTGTASWFVEHTSRTLYAGNFGFGTTSPVSTLVVGGSQSGNAGMEITPGSGIVLQSFNRTGGVYTSINFDGNALGFRPSGTLMVTINATGVTLADATNILCGTSTGTIIATTTLQKLAFHAATPVVQRSGAAQAAVVATGAALASYGYTQSQADAIVTLVNEIRATLVEKGLFKGSA